MSSFSFHESLALISGIAYCLVLSALLVGLRRLPFPRSEATPFVSIIVAARNEAEKLDTLLASLTQQSYPRYEIVIANDRSEDETDMILERWTVRDHRIRVVHIARTPDGWSPKKFALTRAIELATGEILCFTDADCVPPASWVQGIVRYFSDEIGVVVGYSPYDETLLPASGPRTFWRELLVRFIRYEELKGALWSAASIGLGVAWLCTGRNLAYRRAVFAQVNGFERIKHAISGDDDLFLQIVRRTTNWRIAYAMEKETFVPTPPPVTFPAFLQQRIRHFSAGTYFSILMKLFFTSFHAANLLLLVYFVLWLVIPRLHPVFATMFALKTVFDGIFMSVGANRLSEKGLNLSFLLMEILYTLYNSCIGPLGFLVRFEWKPETKS